MIKLVLPFIPPTSNHAQKNALRGRRIVRYNTPTYNAFKERVVQELGNDNLEAFTTFLASPHKVTIGVHSPRVLTKKGQVNKTFSDVDNICKPTIDSIYKPLNANDALIMHLTASKQYADTEYTVIEWEAM